MVVRGAGRGSKGVEDGMAGRARDGEAPLEMQQQRQWLASRSFLLVPSPTAPPQRRTSPVYSHVPSQPQENCAYPVAASMRRSSSGSHGLWSKESGTLAPARHRTARESPALAVTTCVGVTTTQMAVQPLPSFGYACGLRAAEPASPRTDTARTSGAEIAGSTSLQKVRCKHTKGDKGGPGRCRRFAASWHPGPGSLP